MQTSTQKLRAQIQKTSSIIVIVLFVTTVAVGTMGIPAARAHPLHNVAVTSGLPPEKKTVMLTVATHNAYSQI
ncbi:hypothetical protein KBC77_02390 [Candidatus Saccharibacteria bacterium]|nr:hypothetical protein [Candidatus Saccharibacteria bacterium]